MSNFFKMLNLLRRNYPLSLVGGLCLTGLCFSAEKISEALYRPQAGESRFSSVDDVEKPLYGNGVMLFDQSNNVVKKIDRFAYEPSNTAPFSGYEPTEEPQKLRLRNPADAFLRNTQMTTVPLLPETTFTKENYPARLVSSVHQKNETSLYEVQAAQLQQSENVRNAAMINLPDYPVPITSPEPKEVQFVTANAPNVAPVPVQTQLIAANVPTLAPEPTQVIQSAQIIQSVQLPQTAQLPQSQLATTNTLQNHVEQGTQSSIWNTAVQIDALPKSQNESVSYARIENAAEQIAGNGQQDGNVVRVALHSGGSSSEEISADTSELYVTQEQLNRMFAEYRAEQQGIFGRKGRFTFTPYGFINVSTSYETERTVNGDYALYSRSPDRDGGGHSGFHVDPKTSRLGLKIGGPDLPWCGRCVQTSALFEVDFQGNVNGTRNRPGLLFRRGFVDFTYGKTKLLIGQDWEVLSPLVPQSLNYVPGSCAGNLGYRRAQIRLEKTRDWNQDFSTIWQFAICDNVTDALNGVNAANGGWPMFQGRLAASFWKNPHADCLPVTLGISGHVGELRHDYVEYGGVNNVKHESWSANIDLQIPVTERLQLSGEIYTGVNLSSTLGGIMQGVDFFSPGSNQLNPRSVKASGGWGNINYKWTKKLHFNTGFTIEDVPDVIASTPQGNGLYLARTRNQILFLNSVYHWTDYFMTGLEVSQWKTDWHEYDSNTGTLTQLKPGETTRIDFLVKYSF